MYRLVVRKKGPVSLSTSQAQPGITFSQLSNLSFAQPCICTRLLVNVASFANSYICSYPACAVLALWRAEFSKLGWPSRPGPQAALSADELQLAAQLLDVAPAPREVDPLVLGALEAGLGVGPVDELHVLPSAPGLPAFTHVPQFYDDVKIGVNPWNEMVKSVK